MDQPGCSEKECGRKNDAYGNYCQSKGTVSHFVINPFPNKPWLLHVCYTALLKTLWGKRVIARNKQFLAPLAKGQRAIVMALCPSCLCLSVRPCVRVSVNSSFKKLFLRNN